jgi:hypothetical protein
MWRNIEGTGNLWLADRTSTSSRQCREILFQFQIFHLHSPDSKSFFLDQYIVEHLIG